MQKLRKLRSPCLKRAVIGLGLVAAFGAGYRFNEAKWQQLTRRQIKENPQNLTQKPFRMDEYCLLYTSDAADERSSVGGD